jgi:protocatechuate 4,5-dioxygenase beta chain
MLDLGLASSHPAGMLRDRDQWAEALARLLDPSSPNVMPYAAKRELETAGLIESYIERIRAALDTLRENLQAYAPDALVMIGDDQAEMFGLENNPTFAIYTGEEPLWGRAIQHGVPFEERPKVHFPVHAELSRHLLKGLIKREFDIANIARFEPRGPEAARGVPHMVAHVVPQVDPSLRIPIVCVLVNEFYPPLPSAERCAKLGEAIAEVLSDRPERTAIYASGGLSHYPGMFNRGWIDQALDHWILERLERQDIEALKHLFTFDSDNVRAGTGEVRAWIAVAAAMKRPARVVDYVPAHGAITGCGFAYWPPMLPRPTNVGEAAALSHA